MKGGHGRSGPPPDPEALRRTRKDDAGWVVLPATGRKGDPPVWPLPDPSDRELVHWRRLWATPQASEWERLDLVVDVALYVRRLVEVELPGATAAAGNHVIRLSEALGLTTAGLRLNRWHIGGAVTIPLAAGAEGQAQPAGPARTRTSRRSMGARLTVVPADGDG